MTPLVQATADLEPRGAPIGWDGARLDEMLAEHSPGHGTLSMQDRWQIVLARREA